jgi:AMP nucleosidase
MAESEGFRTCGTPGGAVDELARRHDAAFDALRGALERFFDGGPPPDDAERARFRYPELRVAWSGEQTPPRTRRAFARLPTPGVYATTVTHPGHFRAYLEEQLGPLVEEYGATLSVGPSKSEIPYPYVFEKGDELGRGDLTAADLARHFPVPRLSQVGDEIADALWVRQPGAPLPLAHNDAVRVDYSLRRLVHYTGGDWRDIQPWLLLTNYHRYVDHFVRYALDALDRDERYERLVLPGGVAVRRGASRAEAEALVAAAPWSRFQMPAYHLATRDGRGGVSLVNIGVGPSNAKNITDHLAVLRPHCWLMMGHCGGLRPTQTIGDYVLAHAYLRQDHVLDDLVPTDIPIPALAEVQVALQRAAADVTGEKGEALKARLRTGTVVTYDDRNWELRWSRERRRINLSRAIAVDMESGTVAAQGFRLRVPYGTLLCVSDKPLHGEIKLPGAANAFYARALDEHLRIGIAALGILAGDLESLHSRKLRAFDEPPFR